MGRVVDYRDAAHIRRWVSCDSRREAEAVLQEKLRESRQPMRPAVDPNITVAEYSKRWTEMITASLKHRTLASYEQTLRLHIVPVFGAMKLRTLHKGQIKAFLASKLTAALSRNSVRIIHATLRAMLNAAIDDGVIIANPAEKLGRSLRLVAPAVARQEEIKAFTREQVSKSLASAAENTPWLYALFLLLARTGMRLGEALALQWADIDFHAREIRVVRAISARRIETPKSGHGRTVDMSQQLTATLQRLHVQRKREKLRDGLTEMPPWVFVNTEGKPLDESKVRKAFTKVLKQAKLPLHFSPHCLRHTFASLLLQQGQSPAYVQRQLGHASIQLTVDTYGKWLPLGNKAAVDALDDDLGSKVVAKNQIGHPGDPEVADSIGGPSRTRTWDPLIKSPSEDQTETT